MALAVALALPSLRAETLTPGLIEIHFHGLMGIDTNQATADDFRRMSAEAAKRGLAGEERADEVDAVLRAVSDNVLLEIQKTFEFYRSTAASDRLDRLMLCGGGARVHGFAGALADRFGLPVEPIDPFRRITFDAARAGADAEDAASTAVVAVGLALRRAGDR